MARGAIGGAVRDSPDTVLHFDVKFRPGKTLAADVYADEILSRWRNAGAI